MATIAIAAGSHKTDVPEEGDFGGLGAAGAKKSKAYHNGFSGADSHNNPAFQHAIAALEKLSTEDIQDLVQGVQPKPLLTTGRKVLVIWLTWLFGGGLVYSLINDWPYPQSFYYAANVGYSVGYGAIYEYNDISLAWSIFMIFCGASFIGGAVGFFAAAAIESADTKAKRPDATTGPSKKKSTASSALHAISDFYAENTVFVRVNGLLFLWISAGTVYGVHHEGWSTLRSIYFAVSGMSTAGLQAPGTRGEDEEKYIPALGSWFCGVFTATGVPIFGLALSQLGGLLVDKHIAAKEEAAMSRLITRSEFEEVMGLDGTGDAGKEIVGFTEFVVLELIRLGRTDVAQIAHIRGEFNKRDSDASGGITWAEIRGFQVAKAARALEVERLVASGMTRADAIGVVAKQRNEDLEVFADAEAMKRQLAMRGDLKGRKSVSEALATPPPASKPAKTARAVAKAGAFKAAGTAKSSRGPSPNSSSSSNSSVGGGKGAPPNSAAKKARVAHLMKPPPGNEVTML